jgi:hypothetical protein
MATRCAIIALFTVASAQPLYPLVDTLIGTGGFGYGIGGSPPGAQLPFGALRLSPDTSLGPAWFFFRCVIVSYPVCDLSERTNSFYCFRSTANSEGIITMTQVSVLSHTRTWLEAVQVTLATLVLCTLDGLMSRFTRTRRITRIIAADSQRPPKHRCLVTTRRIWKMLKLSLKSLPCQRTLASTG